MNMFERFFDKLLRDAFPSVEPVRFVWGPALSPLKTELLGLRRNHARDEILLDDMIEERNRYAGAQYFFDVAWRPARSQKGIDRLVSMQDRREARIEQIVAKLERDGRMKGPKPSKPGAA